MILIFKVINFELYHIENNTFLLVSHYMNIGKKRFSEKVLWTNNKLEFINNKEGLIIPNYVVKRAKEKVPKFLEPFKKYDAVVYKDVEYIVVNTDSKMQINGEWKDCISYIRKYNKTIFHREKEDFIKKFKKI